MCMLSFNTHLGDFKKKIKNCRASLKQSGGGSLHFESTPSDSHETTLGTTGETQIPFFTDREIEAQSNWLSQVPTDSQG